MTPHPYYQAIIDANLAAGRPFMHQLAPQDARALLRAGYRAAPPPVGLPPMAVVIDETIEGPNGPIPIRRYRPEGDAICTAVYFHSGGWVIGDLDFADSTCRRLAGGAGCELVSVDYRLAPEHPYPQPLDDAYAALLWVAAHRPGPLMLVGESAGGNLAAACAIRARDAGGPPLSGQLLAYPVTDHDLDTPSYRNIGGRNWLLSTADMAYYWDHYCPPGVDRTAPLVSPLRIATAAGLPPTMILVGEIDPLRDEGLAFAEKLAAADVPVRIRRDPDMLHGYLGAAGAIPLAAEAVAEAASWMHQRLRATG